MEARTYKRNKRYKECCNRGPQDSARQRGLPSIVPHADLNWGRPRGPVPRIPAAFGLPLAPLISPPKGVSVVCSRPLWRASGALSLGPRLLKNIPPLRGALDPANSLARRPHDQSPPPQRLYRVTIDRQPALLLQVVPSYGPYKPPLRALTFSAPRPTSPPDQCAPHFSRVTPRRYAAAVSHGTSSAPKTQAPALGTGLAPECRICHSFRPHPKRREYPPRASLLGVLRCRRKFAMSRPARAGQQLSCCVKRRHLPEHTHHRAPGLASLPPQAPATPRRRA